MSWTSSLGRWACPRLSNGLGSAPSCGTARTEPATTPGFTSRCCMLPLARCRSTRLASGRLIFAPPAGGKRPAVTLVDACIAAASHAGEPLPQGLLAEAALMPSSAQIHLGWVVRRLARADGYITSQEVCLQLFGRPTFALKLNRLSDGFRVESVIPGGPQRIQVEPVPADPGTPQALVPPHKRLTLVSGSCTIRPARGRPERTKVRTLTKAWSTAQRVGQMPSPVRGSTLRKYNQRACQRHSTLSSVQRGRGSMTSPTGDERATF